MYKVTASAVILTALTGCSQSGGIPSNQWSFKVPAENEVAGAQVEAEKANSGDASSAKSKLSADAQLANGKSANSPVMGPAFEQPAPDGSSVTKGSIVGRSSSSQQASGLSTTAYSPKGEPTSNLSNIRAYTRPDPVAQVRAYLSSGIPSALTNREPYNSQVYLSSQPPVPQPAYTPSQPISIVSPLGTAPAELSGAKSLSSSVLSPGDATPDHLSSGLPAGVTVTVSPASDFSSNLSMTESGSVGAFVNPAINSSADTEPFIADAAPSENLPSHVGFSAEGIDSDGLPQLLPSVAPFSLPNRDVPLPNEIASPVLSEVPSPNSPNSPNFADIPDIAVASSVSNSDTPLLSEDSSSESVSIGTAILNNLQHSSGLALASNEADSNVTSNAPTLSALTQTMPERELSPLVTNFRASKGGSQLEPVDHIPASSELESNTSIRDVQMDSHSSAPYSPLLEGLRASQLTHDSLEFSSPSTIYVPIAESASPNSSDVLVAEALGVVDVETSTSDFIDELAQSSVFSSVLGSERLLTAKAIFESAELSPLSASMPASATAMTQPASAQTASAQTAPVQLAPAQSIPLSLGSSSSSLRNPELSDSTITEDYVVGGLSLLAFDVSTKLSPAEQSVQRDKARRAKLTLASRQGGNQLQRITWL